MSYDDNGNVSSFNGVTLEHDSQPAYWTDADVFAQETPQDKWIGESIWQRPTTQSALSGRAPTIGMRCQLSALRAHVAGGLGQHAGQGRLVGANGDVGLGYDYRRLRVGESVDLGDDDWEREDGQY